LDYQNNYVENSRMMSNTLNNFDILAIILNVLYNYFDNSIKLFSDLYLAKFLDFLTKSFCALLFTYLTISNNYHVITFKLSSFSSVIYFKIYFLRSKV